MFWNGALGIQSIRQPGLDPGAGFLLHEPMRGGWVYIMANRYRGGMYVGVSASLPTRIHAHREGKGSRTVREKGLDRLVWAEWTERIEDAIAHEKRLKRWRRTWKFELIERGNPDWEDLYPSLMMVE